MYTIPPARKFVRIYIDIHTILWYNALEFSNKCSFHQRKEESCTEEKICGICAECEELLPEGSVAYLLGERLYCTSCVRSSLTAVGVFPVIAPAGSPKNTPAEEKTHEKRLYFKERRGQN